VSFVGNFIKPANAQDRMLTEIYVSVRRKNSYYEISGSQLDKHHCLSDSLQTMANCYLFLLGNIGIEGQENCEVMSKAKGI